MHTPPRYVDAIVVNTRRRGPGQMLGMGADTTTTVLDALTGGTYQDTVSQLDTAVIALKISIVASVLSGIAALAVLFDRRRR